MQHESNYAWEHMYLKPPLSSKHQLSSQLIFSFSLVMLPVGVFSKFAQQQLHPYHENGKLSLQFIRIQKENTAHSNSFPGHLADWIPAATQTYYECKNSLQILILSLIRGAIKPMCLLLHHNPNTLLS